MAGATFQTNPYDLSKLLEWCRTGELHLPDFQRSWVWDEDRIKSLIASVSRRTLGGIGPSEYLARLEKGKDGAPAIAPERLNAFLKSHLIDPALLRANKFEEFMADRQTRLLALIESALGKPAYMGVSVDEEEESLDVAIAAD